MPQENNGYTFNAFTPRPIGQDGKPDIAAMREKARAKVLEKHLHKMVEAETLRELEARGLSLPPRQPKTARKPEKKTSPVVNVLAAIVTIPALLFALAVIGITGFALVTFFSAMARHL